MTPAAVLASTAIHLDGLVAAEQHDARLVGTQPRGAVRPAGCRPRRHGRGAAAGKPLPLHTHLAFGLLGEVVACKRRISWWEALQAALLAPLGMSRTTYLPRPPAAAGFSVHTFADTLTPELTHDAMAMAPAGQVWSRARAGVVAAGRC
ncbi:MAG: hypothetical protein ACR2KG_05415 [Nocardioidaceae bacterium]